MRHSYEQLKQARAASKQEAIGKLIADKESILAGPPSLESLAAPKRRGRPPKKAAAQVASQPKRRGRPPKAREAVAVEEATPAPKRRGRPPKALTEASAPPKRRGRPPKLRTEADAPKRRGRPPKVKTAEAESKPAKKPKINEKEMAILKILNGSGRGRFGSYKIADLGEKCFPDEKPATAQAWVRASLRRPVNSSWVEFVSRGEYRLNLEGRRALQEVMAA